MCGIAGVFGNNWKPSELLAMVASQRHRGPDNQDYWIDRDGAAGLGHNRLSILDLSPAGFQPMWSKDRRYGIVFNGEIYNYLELRAELHDYPYQSHSDTEVMLAAFERWGPAFLNRLVGMFAFLIWDAHERRLFAARDRFGVKPLCYLQRKDGCLLVASEIKALHAAGAPAEPNTRMWASYLTSGLCDHSAETFWEGIHVLPGGCSLSWENGQVSIARWYDLAERVGPEFDLRSEADVEEEYLALLKESVRLRFRSDVPVGINLSGGLDSSTLLGLVQAVQGTDSEVRAFTFVTGDSRYDELPWVRQMLQRTRHPLIVCCLSPENVPDLAASVASHQDEPFGGLPTLAYARLFEHARERGTIVLLDGQGMDEQWAGYDYYAAVLKGAEAGIVQGVIDKPVRPECLVQEFAKLAELWKAPPAFDDPLQSAQFRDSFYTKIPRALRFNDRISMRSSTELREPFLDHRLFELAFRQPPERKISGGIRKRMLRSIAGSLLPQGVVEAPKRPLQTPQREWLRGPLRHWAEEQIEAGIANYGGSWLDGTLVRKTWQKYLKGVGDNSFFVWQWISVGLLAANRAPVVPNCA